MCSVLGATVVVGSPVGPGVRFHAVFDSALFHLGASPYLVSSSEKIPLDIVSSSVDGPRSRVEVVCKLGLSVGEYRLVLGEAMIPVYPGDLVDVVQPSSVSVRLGDVSRSVDIVSVPQNVVACFRGLLTPGFLIESYNKFSDGQIFLKMSHASRIPTLSEADACGRAFAGILANSG